MTTTAPVAVQRYVEHLMGMPVSLALRGRHAGSAAGRQAWSDVLAELGEVDRVFSTYRLDSVVNRLDRGELTVDAGPPEVAEVLALGRRAQLESGGAFSVNLPRDPAVPDGPRRLDPSGVVKGWAVERAARHLAVLDDTDFCLSAGGDLVAHADPGREPWRIGIEDPHNPSAVVAVVPLRQGAVATSGTTHRGAHLVDGRTGRPAAGLASVSVVAGSLTWADIDATAAYALGPDGIAWRRTRPISSAVVVHPDGRTEVVRPHHAPRPTDGRNHP